MPAHPSSDLNATALAGASQPFPLRVFFGHHKCATGWTGGTLREIALHLGRTFRVVNRTQDFAAAGSLGAFVQQNGVEVLSYANASAEHAQTLPPHRGFHVVRDPRDVLVSAYFSHRKTHGTEGWPELVAHRRHLRAVSKHEGLLAEMEFSAPYFEDMLSWDYEQDHVLEVKMEDLTRDPVPHFLQIVGFLDLLDAEAPAGLTRIVRRVASKSNRWNHRGRRFMPGRLPMFPTPKTRLGTLSTELLVEIVEKRTFEKLTGRKRGQENRNTHLRKGVPGDWVNHFEPDHIRAFKDRYNDLLLKLGYVDTPDW
jgi:hypothetical protein